MDNERAPLVPKDAPDQSSTILANVRVLIVEDDLPSQRLFVLLLQSAGARVRCVSSAEAAIAAVGAEPVDLLVVDLLLPGMSGLSFVEQLKKGRLVSLDIAKPIVVVAASVLNGDDILRLARDAGCDACVRKPLDGDAFIAVIARLLGRT